MPEVMPAYSLQAGVLFTDSRPGAPNFVVSGNRFWQGVVSTEREANMKANICKVLPSQKVHLSTTSSELTYATYTSKMY